MKHIIRSTTGAIVAGMIAAGCSTSPPASEVAAAQTAINNAGQAIDHASADPHVAKYAPSEMERASDSLRKATAAWNDKHDLPATTHLAYLAQQRAATAQEFANQRAAEEALTVAAAERDQALSVAAAKRDQALPVASAERRGKPSATTEGQQSLASFASGAAKLPANAMPKIDELATTLKNNPGRNVVVEGHTDNVGSPDYNQALAMKRAEAVRDALLSRGIDPSRIAVRSYGEDNPLASNDTSIGRQENRRAQVIVGDTDAGMVGSSQGSGAATSSGQGGQSGQSGQSGQRGQSGQSGQSGQ
jgi:outer membrane protein OmpA-like peptidoglycan-associated protein